MRNQPRWTLPAAVAAALAATAAAALPAHARHAEAPAGDGPAAAHAAPAAAAAPADWPTYLITVRRGLDPGTVARSYGITPVHVYRHALNGFAAPLSPDQVTALQGTPLVESVEQDGPASGAGATA
ncbi:protease inhibitor I9 family protein [Streptomyces toxytricini]|uniref:protease inhibitor I9 family protein n=1 Tax=Streptomyces toxytricini TaxID=67369 RepID=UPI00343861E0